MAPTWRLKNILQNQRSRWISVALGAASHLSKSAEVRITKNDSISTAYEFCTKSVQSGGLEKNGWREGISGLGRCVAVRRFAREARGYWAFMRARRPAENVGRGRTGGGSATGIQWSPNLECPIFHMGVRLGSKSCIEKIGKFGSEKFSISLACRNRVSKNSINRTRRP